MASSAPLESYKAEFMKICIDNAVLKFGTFELKSKRISPYFFNAGLLNTAGLLAPFADAFALTIQQYCDDNPGFKFDILFGPAYKGIPLASMTVLRLGQLDAKRFGHIGLAFDRKEAKDHGEGGSIVGMPLKGKKVLIIDDVITSGTAIRGAVGIIQREGGTLAGMILAVNRMEKMLPPPGGDDNDGKPRPSAIGEVRREYDVPVMAILTLDNIIAGLESLGTKEELQAMADYREKYKPSY
jgi:orotate phosphoribosyltransferase